MPESGEGGGLPLTDVPRTLVDAVYDWSRFDTLPRAYRWITAAVARDSGLAPRLVQSTCRFGNIATVRRIGHLLERLGADPALLEALRRRLGGARSVIPWIPGRRASGPLSSWGVIANGDIPDA